MIRYLQYSLYPLLLTILSLQLAVNCFAGPTPDFQFLPKRHTPVREMTTEALHKEYDKQRTRSHQYMAGRRTYGLPIGVSPFEEVGHQRVLFRMHLIQEELNKRCTFILEP